MPRMSSHLGRKVRSKLEEEGYSVLSALGVKYVAEPPIGFSTGSYRPDALIDDKIIIEFKGKFYEKSIAKMIQFRKDYGKQYYVVLVVYDHELSKFGGWVGKLCDEVIGLGNFYRYVLSQGWGSNIRPGLSKTKHGSMYT